MTSTRLIAPSLLALALSSCATKKADRYDANPYGAADAAQVNAPANPPANPVYDSPAAYEESTAAITPSTGAPNTSVDPGYAAAAAATPTAPSQAAPRPSTNGAAIIHTVVAGDTLSGISAKYKVPTAAIKQANGMTKDTVVLGKKMVIPPQ
jgi:LysM repeat protein